MSTDPHRSTTGAHGEFQAVDAGAQATTSQIDHPVRGAPSDNTTLISVLSSLEEQGFSSQLIPAENASVQCGACNETSPVSEFEVSATRRLEGASDPDDSAHPRSTTVHTNHPRPPTQRDPAAQLITPEWVRAVTRVGPNECDPGFDLFG